MSPSPAVNEQTRAEWQELGFYYELDTERNRWKILGSRLGLQRFARLFLDYASDPRNDRINEHEHYGPYMYLKIMTWDQAGIDQQSIHGRLVDLRRLSELISTKVLAATIGSTTVVGPDYSAGAHGTICMEMMPDSFDPAGADPELTG